LQFLGRFTSAWSHIVVGLNNMLPRQVSIKYPTRTKMHYMTAIVNKIKYRNRSRGLKGAKFRHGTTVLFSLWQRQELILRSHLGVIHKMHD
jgi:hypothetical protein